MSVDWGQVGNIGSDLLAGFMKGRGGGGGGYAGIGPMMPSAPAYGGGTVAAGGRRHHRRGRGITARDLRSFRRVANLIRTYAAPVRHFRTHPKRRGFGR